MGITGVFVNMAFDKKLLILSLVSLATLVLVKLYTASVIITRAMFSSLSIRMRLCARGTMFLMVDIINMVILTFAVFRITVCKQRVRFGMLIRLMTPLSGSVSLLKFSLMATL